MGTPLNLIQVQNGRKSFGARVLLDTVTFAINEGEHVGVIGPNGAGKSTLFKILVGEETLDSGEVITARALKVGYLSQYDEWHPGETGNNYLERICSIPIWEAKAAGKALRVSEHICNQPIENLSGGYRMRLKILGLLGQGPNLLLLDEPTNYLDLETTLVLENFLQDFSGGFLLISHDREFLRRTVAHTLEVESGQVTKFPGTLDDYFEQKELLREQLIARAKHQEEKRKTILDFVSRFGAKATKAKQAQSRLKSLSKMETIEFRPLPVAAAIKIPKPERVGKTVIHLTKVNLGYGENLVLKDVNLRVERGDHIAVIGMNSAGKSTLLKGLAGTLPPQGGERELGKGVSIAVFDQYVAANLNPQLSVLDSLEEVANPGVSRQEVLSLAGALLFSGDDVMKPVSILSGGEKSRVALGRVLLQNAPCLILDEPTNHLDFHTVEALTQALSDYEGTVIIVSHDRQFVRRVGRKIIEVQNGQAHIYPGSYDDYVWRLQNTLLGEERKQTPVKSRSKIVKNTKKPQVQEKEIRKLERKIRSLEESIKEKNKKVQELKGIIENDNGSLSQSYYSECSEVMEDLDLLESEWLNVSSELEGIKKDE